jgi:hypothetical protein
MHPRRFPAALDVEDFGACLDQSTGRARGWNESGFKLLLSWVSIPTSPIIARRYQGGSRRELRLRSVNLSRGAFLVWRNAVRLRRLKVLTMSAGLR